MTGRARARARGRPPRQEAAGPMAGDPAVAPDLPGQLGETRQPRRADVPSHPSGEPGGHGRLRGLESVQQERRPEGLRVSSGLQDLCLRERGGRRRDYHDLGVNTRQTMVHVQESKTGVSGRMIKLTSNHYRLTSRPQWALYQYHVGYSPEMESRRLRSALLFQHEEHIGRTHAFDGSILFLPQKLRNKVTELFSRTRNGEDVKITITLTNELPPTSPTCLHFYNIIFRRLLKMLNLQQIGRNYYNPGDPVSIPNHRLMVWPGFSSSILQYEESIMLCADVSHKVLRGETVLDVMHSLHSQVGEERFRDACAKELIGLIVLTRYNNRTYRIDDINWDSNPMATFRKSDGAEITFLEYYKKQYNIDIGDPKQPVLISQLKKSRNVEGTVVLIPELCSLTGLTEKMRTDFNMMKDLAAHTRLPPEQRQWEVGRLLNYIQKDDNVQKELGNWGLSFDYKSVTFTGRVVQGEKIFQSGNMVDYNPQFADWTKETRGVPLIRAVPMDNWLLIHTRRNHDVANTLIQSLYKVTPSMGIRMSRPTTIEVDDRTEAYLRVLQQRVTPDTNIVVCILSSSRKDKYDAIKKYLCTDCPIPSQCVLARTLSKHQTIMTVATKIALQMNCKMGGELWSVEIPLKQVMIVGIDCYHDTVTGRQSVAGFVSSLNQTMTRWFSRCVVQSRGQELVDGIKACLQTALRNWLKWNKCLPSRIFVYRDGVGDGQLHTLVHYEVPQFLDCLKDIGSFYRKVEPERSRSLEELSPRLTVIVVKKRVGARFFAEVGGGLKNPPPGTVVDTVITRPEWYDFFVVSHTVKNGCVTPTHYNVIYDGSQLKPDHLQRLTYKLCHMYYNWSGVIRVPAPCQYAHKLAFLVGQSIHREPNLMLSDRLYYL
ncbi:piwi-like protein 1 [Pipra filicauda]|uniref:Piwi-like protein 1 n=1 Tax=Pipra filicauda TaxID=649802 RepID=A0A6J2HM76_9PASS|nr:piwi-like protein 1 [Pipra filicauda]XP_039234816.1 piwi-like protein 1 [Pipra filicauda]